MPEAYMVVRKNNRLAGDDLDSAPVRDLRCPNDFSGVLSKRIGASVIRAPRPSNYITSRAATVLRIGWRG